MTNQSPLQANGMGRKNAAPWGVHRISDIYSPHVQASIPGGTKVFVAVLSPYTGNRFQAAWWVFTGRAFAFQWPELGDLERALRPLPTPPAEESE